MSRDFESNNSRVRLVSILPWVRYVLNGQRMSKRFGDTPRNGDFLTIDVLDSLVHEKAVNPGTSERCAN